MDKGIEEKLLTVKLNERNIIYFFRKDRSLNSFDLDILLFTRSQQILNVYEARKHFKHTNIQTIRRSISRLHQQGLLELLRAGIKNKPALYWLTSSGQQAIEIYIALLGSLLTDYFPSNTL